LLPAESLKDILHRPGLSKSDQLLICLAVDADRPKSTREVIQIARNAGLDKVAKWNISAYLSKQKGKVIRTPQGWVLIDEGKEYVRGLVGEFIKLAAKKIATSLRTHLGKIKDPNTLEFVEEAIKCCEAGYWRAAVVLSWAGAVSVLYDYVVKNRLSDFNTEAIRRDPKWKPAKTTDDLGAMKEFEFLQVIKAINTIGKNEKQKLEQCLQLRNACGHPSSLNIGEHITAGHIEMLILNVYSKF
jgi:hypothetical protein